MTPHSGHSPTTDQQDLYYTQRDTDHAHYALLALGGLSALVLLWTTASRFSCYIRQITGSHSARRHFLYAPLLRIRHHREFRLSRAVQMGTVPSRPQAAILAGILALNVALCTVNVPYNSERAAAVIQNRTGTMATMNLIPLVLIAGRNNPLIPLLRISYDTFNLIHRWLARIVVLEALAHVLAWCVLKDLNEGWDTVRLAFKESSFIRTGLIAACAFVFLVIHSPSPIRHAFYETFLHLHICIAVTSFIFLWAHLNGRHAQRFLLGAILLWTTERAARILTIAYRNASWTATTAVIESIPDSDLVRIALRVPHPWSVSPGQHIYLYMPSISLWSSHPFSVCWSKDDRDEDENQHASDKPRLRAESSKQVYILIHRRTGFTATLARCAGRSVNKTLAVHALVEGPYGGIHSLDSYGTVLLVAGGVGITHHLLYLQRLANGQVNRTVAARRITLVWAIRSIGYWEAVEDWIASIARVYNGKEKRLEEEEIVEKESDGHCAAGMLRILIYITGSCDADAMRAIRIGGQVVLKVFRGRPNFGEVLAGERESQIGAMGVLCCGNGGLSDDVRQACREAQSRTRVDFFEESFTW
ncbi:ferric reductase like transmembrane component-domain-containing protein [Aspergillus heterothallicus]